MSISGTLLATNQSKGGEETAECELLEKHESRLKTSMKERTGLNIDVVRPGGAGNSNDGNTARRFFSNPALVASILQIDETLIRRFSVILRAISCFHKLKKEAMIAYCMET